MSANRDWQIFTGPDSRTSSSTEKPGAVKPVRSKKFPAPPPWRNFQQRDHRAKTYQPGQHEIDMVNAALYLRRPLLITGKPGTGKSSLIYAVAAQLQLGPVLVWPISSRSTVRDGIYQYDAIGRLRDANLNRSNGRQKKDEKDLSKYLSLGPLGTALLPSEKPRALLIDEVDKADVDFPNDLLHVFEEGCFEIPEARRIGDTSLLVRRADSAYAGKENGPDSPDALINNGQVQCTMFPFVVLTSNGERDLPPAFLRRCLRLRIDAPDETQLIKIVSAHFPEIERGPLAEEINTLIQQVARGNREKGKVIATDQLLNAIHLIRGERAPEGEQRQRVIDELLRELGQGQ